MIILSQDRKKIINFDNIDLIDVDENMIVVTKNNKRSWIGTYDTIIRAKEVLEEIANYKFNNSVVVMNQEELKWETTNQSEIYYMPEK